MLVGLDLLAAVSEQGYREVESVRPEWVWPVEVGDFTEECERSRGYVAANDR